MSGHTPGPWFIEEYGDDDAPALVIHKDSETRVCFMATPGSHGDPAKIEADACLIAAAPKMLTTLQVTLNWLYRVKFYEGRSCDDPAVDTHLENIKEAIAEARGDALATGKQE